MLTMSKSTQYYLPLRCMFLISVDNVSIITPTALTVTHLAPSCYC